MTPRSVGELDEKIADLGVAWERTGSCCRPVTDEEVVELDRLARTWYNAESRDIKLIYAHAWHRYVSRAGLGGGGGGVGRCRCLSLEQWRSSGYDAWSPLLYTDVVSVDELVRVFVGFLLRSWEFVDRGIRKGKAGISDVRFSYFEERDLVRVRRALQGVIAHTFGSSRSALYVPELGEFASAGVLPLKVRGGSWTEMVAFGLGARTYGDVCKRLASASAGEGSRRINRRPGNAIAAGFDNMYRGSMPLVLDIANQGSMRENAGGGGEKW
jgi:hypothetical protein